MSRWKRGRTTMERSGLGSGRTARLLGRQCRNARRLGTDLPNAQVASGIDAMFRERDDLQVDLDVASAVERDLWMLYEGLDFKSVHFFRMRAAWERVAAIKDEAKGAIR